MVTALIFLSKILYWVYVGWWLEPIKYFRRKKIEKMENEITKAKYQELQEQKQKKEEI